MVSKAKQDYYDALERLKAGKPINVPVGSLINKDTVALEAGKKRGSIRNRSDEDSLLIQAIEFSAAQFNKKSKESSSVKIKNQKDKLDNKQEEIDNIKSQRDEAYSRYMSLLMHNYQLQRELRKLGKPIPTVAEGLRVEIHKPD